MVCEQAKHSKTLRLKALFATTSPQCVTQEMIRNLDGKKEVFTGESSHPVCRLTIEQNSNELGAGEPRRGRGNAKGVRVIVIFDMGLVI
jgi:hypothetical protein